MLKPLATFLFVLSGVSSLSAATYYLSPAGSDSNTGTASQPWATYPKAVSVAVAGDTVLVQPGIYSHDVNTNRYPELGGVLYFGAAGTSNALITFRALGPVTNQFEFYVSAPYYYFDGFTWDSSSAFYLHRGSGHVTMTNCTVQNTINGVAFTQQEPDSTQGAIPETAPSYCTVINSTFNRMTNACCVTLMGVGNLVQGCTFANGAAQDSIYPFGSNNVIRLNVFTNMTTTPDGSGYGNHPDIMQVFGQNGVCSVNTLFEQNYVVKCPIQLMQFETIEYGSVFPFGQPAYITNSYLWGIVLRNNVFEDSNMQCSIDTPNARFYNNTFRRCSNGGNLLSFAFYDPNNSSFRGAAYGGSVINNAFIDCSGSYSAVASGPSQGDLTNGTLQVKGRANISEGDSTFYVWGVFSNLSGTITSGTLGYSGGDFYTINATSFTNGAFNVTIPINDPANGFSSGIQFGSYNAGGMVFRLNTTAVTNGEVKAALLPYAPDMSAIYAASDYNYKGKSSELHGLQSGDTKPTATNGYPAALAAPMLGSVLIGAGTNLGSLGVTNDFSGNARPLSSSFDIGAFEYTGGHTQSRPMAPAHLSVVLPGM